MKITDIYVSNYGLLKDKRISFSDSVNVIEGENESGKSTLTAFITFMLYGGSDDIDRIKVSDGQCGGTMTVESEKHGRIQIQRYATVSGKRYSDTVNMFLLPSMKEITTKKSVGEYIFGIGKQFFCETAFVSQKGASGYNPKNVNDSIQNILLSASESYNTERALKKIDEVRKFFALKRGRGGAIADLEDRKSALISENAANEKSISDADITKEEIERLTIAKGRYEGLIEDIFTEKKARTARDKANAERELEEKKTVLERKKETAANVNEKCNAFSENNIRGKLRELDLKLKYDEARIADIENDIEKNKNIGVGDLSAYSHETAEKLVSSISDKRKSVKNLLYIAYLFATISVLLVLSTVLLAVFSAVLPALITSSLSLASACFMSFALSRKAQTTKELKKLIFSYGYEENVSISEIRADFIQKIAQKNDIEAAIKSTEEKKLLLADIKEKKTETETSLTSLLTEILVTECKELSVENAEEYITECFIKLENLKSDISRLTDDIERLKRYISAFDNECYDSIATNPRFDEYSDVELDSAFEKANAEITSLSERILENEKALSVLRTSIAPREKYASLIKETEEILQLRREQLDIVRLSEEAVKYASENIRSAITPGLISEGDRLFSAITNDRYNAIGFTDDLSPSTVNGDIIKKKAELSYGTNEAMYLAFRSALILTLCKSELPPMMLDESFAHIDNARTLECIKLLASSKIQSLVFTCNDREKRILTENGVSFTHITI